MYLNTYHVNGADFASNMKEFIPEGAVMKSIRTILAASAMLFLSATASANVIYDVVARYYDGFSYSFSMEFASVKSAYSTGDLVGGDVQNQTLFCTLCDPGAPGYMTRVDDGLATGIFFDANTHALQFESRDLWNYGPYSTVNLINHEVLGAGVLGSYYPFYIFDIAITQRAVPNPEGNPVPEPETYIMMLAGIALLSLMARQPKRSRQQT